MVVTESGMVIEIKPDKQKAAQPMLVTCAPDKSSEFKPVQLEKARSPMVVSELPK